MKKHFPSPHRGAAIVLTLVFIAGIAALAISLLSISSQQTRNSGYRAQSIRAELATDAAFEEAKNLLLSQTANDSYQVTSILDRDWSGDPPSRYSFVVQPGENEIRYVPLFSTEDASATQTKGYPSDIHANPVDGDGKSDLAPTIPNFDPTSPRPFQLSPLTHLHPDTGELVRENSRPPVHFLEIDAPDSNHTLQYAYWIEDLQGYPNLDHIGIPAQSKANGQALRWGGYTEGDARLGDPTVAQDYIYSLEDYSLDPYVFEFPGVIPEATLSDGSKRAAQFVANQIAPGLSPRELHFFPWQTEQFEAEEHPYWRTTYLRANQATLPSIGTSVILAQVPQESVDRDRFGIDLEERFVLGLRGYRHQPIIPFGHGYPNEGEPAMNVNEFIYEAQLAAEDDDPDGVNDALFEMADHLEDSLPDFEERKGGFPEHYGRTLIASMIDYADEGSAPTLSDPDEFDEEERFRGMDNYPLVNEFFVHFELSEKPDNSSGGGPLTFTAQAWVELWNPTNEPSQVSNLQLRFSFIEPLSFQEADGTEHTLDEVKTFQKSFTGTLGPNELRIVDFGDVEWEFNVDKTPGVPWVFTGADGPDRKDGRGHYELLFDDKVIEMSGREPDKMTNTGFPDHGLHVSRFTDGVLFAKDYKGNRSDGQVRKGDAMMFATAPALNVGDKASNYGDVRMNYWVSDTQEAIYYVNWSSPGVRNFLRKLYKRSSKGRGTRFDMEAVPSQWPDGGYDSPTYNVPSSTSNSSLNSLLRTSSSDSARFVYPDNSDDYTSNGRTMPNLRTMAEEANDANIPAPFRASNQGRLFALSELGHVYDPIMWKPYGNARPYDYYLLSSNKNVSLLHDLTSSAQTSEVWGGGNTLRIGRREHPKFDTMGQRAAQLLDIFHVGVPGTNCKLGTGQDLTDFAADDTPETYAKFDAAWHQPPPTAPDEKTAKDNSEPYLSIYPKDLHASSPFEWVHGQLNINSIPTLFELEAFLQGVLSGVLMKDNPDWQARQATEEDVRLIDEPLVTHGEKADFETTIHELNQDAAATAKIDHRDPNSAEVEQKTIRDIAKRLYDRRPYFSRSDLVYEIAEAVAESRPSETEQKASALPEHRDDALSEEVAARILNTTTLGSRHFRIYTHGRVVSKQRTASGGFVLSEGGNLLAQDSKVYEVFLEPDRDPKTGELRSTIMRILNVRSL